MALWQAKEICPDIIFVSPRMDLYLRFSRMAHEIYAEYTDRQEPYGIDECWLDVTGSSSLKGDGLLIAQEISRRMKSELGVTVSVGVSFNKIFAKLGSDYKEKRKPIMLPRFSCHIFRHTFASRICENETNVKIIQQLMGHADVSTTMNIYAEVNAESTRESIENLAKNLDVF